jgi:L-galactose dehydrogenase
MVDTPSKSSSDDVINGARFRLERRKLGQTGLVVSVLGFGASPLGGVFRSDIDEADACQAVHEAFYEYGVNFFDTSPYYGLSRSETVLGKALARLGERDDYVLATKVGRYGAEDFDFTKERVRQSVQASMERLGVRRLDLVQCHDIEFASSRQVIIEEALPALSQLKQEGVIGAIGITGYPLSIYQDILEMSPVELDVALSYCHGCLCDTSLADSGTLAYLNERGIGVINASPLCMGLLTAGGPPAWHPAPLQLKQCCREAAKWYAEQRARTGGGTDLAELALQFAVFRFGNRDIASTLVGIDSTDTLRKDIAALSGSLNDDLLNGVQRLLAPVHNLSWSSGVPRSRWLGAAQNQT